MTKMNTLPQSASEQEINQGITGGGKHRCHQKCVHIGVNILLLLLVLLLLFGGGGFYFGGPFIGGGGIGLDRLVFSGQIFIQKRDQLVAGDVYCRFVSHVFLKIDLIFCCREIFSHSQQNRL